MRCPPRSKSAFGGSGRKLGRKDQSKTTRSRSFLDPSRRYPVVSFRFAGQASARPCSRSARHPTVALSSSCDSTLDPGAGPRLGGATRSREWSPRNLCAEAGVDSQRRAAFDWPHCIVATFPSERWAEVRQALLKVLGLTLQAPWPDERSLTLAASRSRGAWLLPQDRPNRDSNFRTACRLQGYSVPRARCLCGAPQQQQMSNAVLAPLLASSSPWPAGCGRRSLSAL
jgi:hypothetical protein